MPQAAGDPIRADRGLIEIRIPELKRLFNQLDLASFRERGLDPNAEEFIVSRAREAPRDVPIALLIHLDRPPGRPEEPELLREAIRQFFRHRAEEEQRNLRSLFARGRISLVIGLLFLAAMVATGDFLAIVITRARLAAILRESLLIGGWVAMWRPLEIFLYDWWPILVDRRLYERLATVSVRIAYADRGTADAWRYDWPAEGSSVTPTPA